MDILIIQDIIGCKIYVWNSGFQIITLENLTVISKRQYGSEVRQRSTGWYFLCKLCQPMKGAESSAGRLTVPCNWWLSDLLFPVGGKKGIDPVSWS